MKIRTFILVLLLNISFVIIAHQSQARPINFCTQQEYNAHQQKISKIDSLLEKWTTIQTLYEQAPPLTQQVIRQDVRYVKMKNHVQTVSNLKSEHESAKTSCILETDIASGTSHETTVSTSEPVLTSVYTDSSATTTNDSGSTVVTVTRTTVITRTVIKTTTVKSTPYTTYYYDNDTTETEYSDPTYSTTTIAIATVLDPVNQIISTTVTANQISTETTDQVSSSYSDSEPTISTSYADSDAVISEVVTNGSSSTSTTTSDGDPTQSTSYVDTSETVDNGLTLTTIVTRTTTITTTTPRYTRNVVTFVRNTKTYSTITRTTTTTNTKIRTTTTNTTPITTVTYSDGTTTTSAGVTTTTTSDEDIVTTSTSAEDIQSLVSDVDATVTSSDTTTTENIVSTTTSSAVISSTTVNKYTSQQPEYYRTDEFNLSSGSLSTIKADYAYARGFTGDNIKVGVLDTGIKCNHTDLDDNMSSITYTTQFGDGCNDTHGHGTHVAGIIAAEKNDSLMHGVAYDAEIHSAKIGNGPRVFISTGAQQASIMADNDVKAINLSANYVYDNFFKGNIEGYEGYSTYNNGSTTFYYHTNSNYNLRQSGSVNEWKSATDKGAIIVNSAGNDGIDFAAEPGIYATAVDGNGNLVLGGKMIIVGAVDNDGNIASFSNRAGHFCQNKLYTNGAVSGCADTYQTKQFYIVAPGVRIKSTDDDGMYATDTLSGTSMAAPHVTGAIAVLYEAWPQLSANEIVTLLFTTATDLGAPGIDNVYGNGLLNLDEATKPQGTSTISTSNGSSNVASTSMTTSSVIGSISSFETTMFTDEYNRDYYFNINQTISKSTNSLTLAHNYKSFSGMEEIYVNNYTFGVNERNVNNVFMGYKHGVCGYNVGTMQEDGSFLGTVGTGALEFANSNTQYMGMNCIKHGFRFNYDVGYSSIQGTDNSIIKNGTAISNTWSIGWTNKDWNVEFGQPLAITDGELNVDVASSVNANGTHNYSNYSVNIDPDHRHTVAKIGWQSPFITDNVNVNVDVEYNNNYANTDSDSWSIATGVEYVF